MTPRNHRDDRETTVFPQALVRDLRAQEGTLWCGSGKKYKACHLPREPR